MNARPFGAAGLGAAGTVLLHAGGAPWPAALLAGAGVVAFVLVRTVSGVWAGFALLVAAALAAWLLQSERAARVPLLLLPWLGGLEIYGLATIAAVRAVREPVRFSRRLLGAWLASTGALVLGLALSAERQTADAASALLAFGLMYKLGVVPAYAWAPMLIRHPSPGIVVAGGVGMAGTLLILLVTLPWVGNSDIGAATAAVLSAVTAPWALYKVVRQWRTDRRCAGTYAVVAMTASALLWLMTRVVS